MSARERASREGWVSVPLEPTEAMESGGQCASSRFVPVADINAIYKAMLSASTAPTEGVETQTKQSFERPELPSAGPQEAQQPAQNSDGGRDA